MDPWASQGGQDRRDWGAWGAAPRSSGAPQQQGSGWSSGKGVSPPGPASQGAKGGWSDAPQQWGRGPGQAPAVRQGFDEWGGGEKGKGKGKGGGRKGGDWRDEGGKGGKSGKGKGGGKRQAPDSWHVDLPPADQGRGSGSPQGQRSPRGRGGHDAPAASGRGGKGGRRDAPSGRGRSDGGRGGSRRVAGRGGGMVDCSDDSDDSVGCDDYDDDRGFGKGVGYGKGGKKGGPRPAPREVEVAGPKSSGVRFSSLRGVSEGTQRALREVLRYEFLTPVQNETLPFILRGGDVLAKAKTGTGKTCAFLLPTIEQIVARSATRCIGALVLSPTRELARQTATESEKLHTFHGLRTACVVGGTNIRTEQTALRGVPNVLVATPGRLQDHLDNTPGCREMLGGIATLILDECDQLVDMGFWPAIERILSHLPPVARRQNLLFSATMNDRVRRTASVTMRPGFAEVDTIGEEVQTADNVPQSVIVTDLDSQIETLATELDDACRESGYKVMVFFTTARLTQWYAELFQRMQWPVLEIHSRKSQSHREKASEKFRKSVDVIMFSSDVSARGMDYPDVTHVFQVGAPSSREQYVHRLGRTARAGKAGVCCLFLTPWETFFISRIRDLPVEKRPARADPAQSEAVAYAKTRVDRKSSSQAYQAWLGYYNSLSGLKMDKVELVRLANHFSSVMGLAQVPALQKKTVGKMGLKGVPGLRIE